MAEFVIPDEVEESVGWRGWKIRPDGLLCAIVHDEQVWLPGEPLKAICAKGKRHPVPFMNCSCGFYGTKSFDDLRRQDYHIGGAFGLVSYWGRLVDYTGGYRAEYSYPREIWIPYTMLQWVEPLSVYGVPVRLANPYTAKEAELTDGGR